MTPIDEAARRCAEDMSRLLYEPDEGLTEAQAVIASHIAAAVEEATRELQRIITANQESYTASTGRLVAAVCEVDRISEVHYQK